MNFVAVSIVSAIVLGHPSRLLIGLNRILLCLNHSSQITKFYKIVGPDLQKDSDSSILLVINTMGLSSVQKISHKSFMYTTK